LKKVNKTLSADLFLHIGPHRVGSDTKRDNSRWETGK